jgi:RNA polymerase sigma factor (sigma-70 family)
MPRLSSPFVAFKPSQVGRSSRHRTASCLRPSLRQATTLLSQRHGPTVLGVCRRILRDHHSADDAFQTTFLVLARKAAAVRDSASVGGWLHGVAVRVASKLKARLLRLPRTGELPECPAEGDDLSWREVRRILDEEVARLPERLRLPILLCYFEGRTRDEAAAALGCKVSTLRGRIEDSRERLRIRLALRGIELSAALLAVSAVQTAAVGEGLLRATIEGTKGAASPVVKSLAASAMTMAAVGQLKWVAAAVLVATLGIGTTAMFGTPGEPPTGDPPVKSPPATNAVDPPKEATSPKLEDWGEPAGDFQLRLRKPDSIEVGKMPELICDLKNVGKEQRSIHCAAEFAAVELDSLWYSSHRDGSIEGRTIDLAASEQKAPWLTVRPDSSWLHLKDNPDPDKNKEAVPFRLPVGKHKVRVAYRLSKTERAVSNVVEVEILPDGWGNTTIGVKSRLRLTKAKFKVGEPLSFELDLRNEGKKDLSLPAQWFDCRIQFDGYPYRYRGPVNAGTPVQRLKAGETLSPGIAVTTDGFWKVELQALAPADLQRFRDRDTLELTPGKHTIEVKYPIVDMVGPVSNTVTFEVEPAPLDPAVAAMAHSADRIWVVPSPTREKPVPTASQVLKGPPIGSPEMFDLRLLPADDPKKTWIAFLQVDEDGQPSPVVKLLPGPKWNIENTAGTADAIRLAIQPAFSETNQGGLQLGLRLRATKIDLGQPVAAEVTIRNVGKVAQTIEQHRLNIYDYWPNTTFTVKGPDGSTWILAKPAGSLDEFDRAHPMTLRPGESYTQSMRLDRWSPEMNAAERGGVPTNVFTAPGEYVIKCKYLLAKDRIRDWAGTLESESIRLKVTGPNDWGEETNGIQARLRLAKAKFLDSDPLAFELDLRNRGTKNLAEPPKPEACEIELDGVKYTEHSIKVRPEPKTQSLKPNGQIDGWLKVTTNEWWANVRPGPGPGGSPFPGVPQNGLAPKPGGFGVPPHITTLALTPGKHTVRVSYQLRSEKSIRVVSPVVEFVVERDPWGKLVEGIQSRVRLPQKKFRDGDPLIFELDIRNRTDVPFKEGPMPSTCEIVWDGVAYRDTGLDRFDKETVPAQGQVDGWTKVSTEQFRWMKWTASEYLSLTPGKHTLVVTYQMTPPNKMKVVSQTLEIDVEPMPTGKAVEGVRARLRSNKDVWKLGESPQFDFELTNEGKSEWNLHEISRNCLLEVDGVWYECETGRVDTSAKSVALPPGAPWQKRFEVFADAPRNGGGSWVVMLSDDPIRPAPDSQKLKLKPGKHTFRVAFFICKLATDNKQPPLESRIETNSVEIEVRAADEPKKPK